MLVQSSKYKLARAIGSELELAPASFDCVAVALARARASSQESAIAPGVLAPWAPGMRASPRISWYLVALTLVFARMSPR